MIRLTPLLLGLPLMLLAMPATGQSGKPNTGLPTTRLTIGTHTLTAEVAATDTQRMTGLMHRCRACRGKRPSRHGFPAS